ncbi:MAG: hypothetical protein KF770_15275 [Anaerolineae bacterium]|nr:hypothetical protein [Anaerolineae bacterium]
MTTITFELSDDLAERLTQVGDRLPDVLSFALDMAGIPENDIPRPASTSPVWLEAIDFLASGPASQAVIDFKLSAESQARLEELLDWHRSGSLTPQESAELAAYRQINHLFILLKARARHNLAN